jgi:tetratricopeptide (TPR) repeat protein
MSETLLPQDLLAEGQKAYKKGQFASAAQSFTQAARGFAAAGNKLDAAEASNNASVAFLQAEDANAALQATLGTDQVFLEAKDTRRQGIAVANQAAALEGLNRLDEALDAYNRSADLLKQAGESEMRAVVLKSISTLQIRTGKQLQALASMDAALETQKKLSLKERFLKKLLRMPLDMLNKRE